MLLYSKEYPSALLLFWWIVKSINCLFNSGVLCLLCWQEYSQAGQSRQREKLLVCTPDPRNITQIFIPLMNFIEEIERAIGCTPGSPCTLNAFLSDYIKEVFLGRHHVMVAASIESTTKSLDAWRTTTSPELMSDLGLSRPLLQVSHSCHTSHFVSGIFWSWRKKWLCSRYKSETW